MGKFDKVSVIKEAASLSVVHFANEKNRLDDKDCATGFLLKLKLRQMQEDDDTGLGDKQKIYRSTGSYFLAAAQYAVTHLPLDVHVLHRRHHHYVPSVVICHGSPSFSILCHSDTVII